MHRKLSALLGLGGLLITLGACGEEVRPPSQIAELPLCLESDAACNNGRPLCARDEGDACLMCRCIVEPPLTSDAPIAIFPASFLPRTTSWNH
jgi:hypothetical protein